MCLGPQHCFLCSLTAACAALLLSSLSQIRPAHGARHASADRLVTTFLWLTGALLCLQARVVLEMHARESSITMAAPSQAPLLYCSATMLLSVRGRPGDGGAETRGILLQEADEDHLLHVDLAEAPPERLAVACDVAVSDSAARKWT